MGIRSAKSVALIGIMVAMLEGGKLALMTIPNVEVVTLFCALFGYVFGVYGIIASVLFVICETMIWGFGTWAIGYFLYWPLVAFVFMMLGRAKIRNRWVLTGIAVALTAFFGVLTSLVDIGLFSGSFQNFWQRFAIYYARGIVFYVIQIVCNLVLFISFFVLLSKLLYKMKGNYFSREIRKTE
ncbi:MAG: hypothetical protein PHX51_03510 [Clostridia bacterium]|nr:hypothetical protein [Clostridia bacterium]